MEKIKKSFNDYYIFYSDEIIRPGDRVSENISDSLKNVQYCFIIVSGEITPRQKKEIKELKNNGAKITPVILGENTKVPAMLQNYQPISMDSFLATGNKAQ